jgi:small conductance mechanosensitive channel
MILLYRPYDIGDVVNVAGTSGTVVGMSLVSTTLRSDHQVITIPNGSIWGGTITNGTAQKPAGSA